MHQYVKQAGWSGRKKRRMKSIRLIGYSAGIILFFLITIQAISQPAEKERVVVTGVRFAYPLVQKWIEEFNAVRPDIEIVIESRSASDPAQYDILIEAYEQDEDVRATREYLHIARYAVLPIANSESEFAKVYGRKGLTTALIKQLYFDDLLADKDQQEKIEAPYMVYTRLQRAGTPRIFAKYFGYTQDDYAGKAISGADAHLVQAVIKDQTAISYAPLSLIYDLESSLPQEGIAVLPVDLNGNRRVTDDERIFGSLADVLGYLEQATDKTSRNIPVDYLHLSVQKITSNKAALEFIKWVAANGVNDLNAFGYLSPDQKQLSKETEQVNRLNESLKMSMR